METPCIKNICMAVSLCFIILICGCGVESSTKTSNAPDGELTQNTSNDSGKDQETPSIAVQPAPDLPVSSESEKSPATDLQANTPSSPRAEDSEITITTPVLEAATTGSATSAPAVAPAVEVSAPAESISIQPATIPQNEDTSITITGKNLSGARVEFRRNKEETTFPEIIEEGGNALTIMRTLNEAPLVGKWDVVVIHPDGTTAELPDGLEIIEPGTEAPAVVTPPGSAGNPAGLNPG